jgi:hypothetical protein
MKMSGEEKLAEFLQAIDNWISSKYLVRVKPSPEIEEVLNASYEEINGWSSEKCSIKAFQLYAYAEYLETEKSKEKNILDWAESSIWFIIGSVLNQYGTQYAKWQEKYYSAVKENPLASDILKIKNHSEARVRTLEGKNGIIIKMAETLNNLARRR